MIFAVTLQKYQDNQYKLGAIHDFSTSTKNQNYYTKSKTPTQLLTFENYSMHTWLRLTPSRPQISLVMALIHIFNSIFWHKHPHTSSNNNTLHHELL